MPIPLIPPQLTESVSKMLWDFGFRHHPELQSRWISGSAGLGCIANISDKRPVFDFEEAAEDFLAENNPDLLAAVQNSSPEERAALLKKLERNFDELRGLIAVLKDG